MSVASEVSANGPPDPRQRMVGAGADDGLAVIETARPSPSEERSVEDLVDSGICPSCQDDLDEDDLMCPSCGWSAGVDSDDGPVIGRVHDGDVYEGPYLPAAPDLFTDGHGGVVREGKFVHRDDLPGDQESGYEGDAYCSCGWYRFWPLTSFRQQEVWEALAEHLWPGGWRSDEEPTFADPGYDESGKKVSAMLEKAQALVAAGRPIQWLSQHCKRGQELDRRDGVPTEHGCIQWKSPFVWREQKERLLVCVCKCHAEPERPRRCGTHQHRGCTNVATMPGFGYMERAWNVEWDGLTERDDDDFRPVVGLTYGSGPEERAALRDCADCHQRAKWKLAITYEIGDSWFDHETGRGWVHPAGSMLWGGPRQEFADHDLSRHVANLYGMFKAAGYKAPLVNYFTPKDDGWIARLAEQYSKHGRIVSVARALNPPKAPPVSDVPKGEQEALF